MAFKLTYTDGQEAEYDDDTAWEVDDGVLKMGRTEGDWTVLVSPSHWAVVEVGSAASRKSGDKSENKDKSGDKSEDKDSEDMDSEDKDKDTSDDKSDKSDEDDEKGDKKKD